MVHYTAIPIGSLTAWESMAEYAELKPVQTVRIEAGAPAASWC